jgi:hypothetical protein
VIARLLATVCLSAVVCSSHSSSAADAGSSVSAGGAATHGRSELLLRPRVDLSLMTAESFAVSSGLVGPAKIRRPWTEPVKALQPHPRTGVQGLTRDEVRSYMLEVRRLFDAGEAVPISDVGSISTEDGPVRKPMFNHVAVFANDVANVYLLVQREAGDRQWHSFSIVQDKTVQPPADHYGRIEGDRIIFKGARCYRCHASGPLAIHPARPDLVSDPRLAEAINAHIKSQPPSRFVFTPDDPAFHVGKPLAMAACAECHGPDGDRGPLYAFHEHPIRVLVANGLMPPDRSLTADEATELKRWLDPLAGTWRETDVRPAAAVLADVEDWRTALSDPERAGVRGVKYYGDGDGGIAVGLTVQTSDTPVTHLLVYDQQQRRTDVRTFIPAP